MTSRQYSTRAPTSGSERRSRTVAWIRRQRPSACQTRAVRTASSLCWLGGPFSAPSSVGASSGWTAAWIGLPSTTAASSPSRSAMASETKVTCSRSSRMTTGSTLLLTSVRNEVWLRSRAPDSRRWRCQSTAIAPTSRASAPTAATSSGAGTPGEVRTAARTVHAVTAIAGTAKVPVRPPRGATGTAAAGCPGPRRVTPSSSGGWGPGCSVVLGASPDRVVRSVARLRRRVLLDAP